LLCSGVLETPCLAVRVMIYSNGEYIPVIKCIGYKQNHGADPDLLPPHQRVGYTKTGPRASSPRITYTRTHASHLTRHDSRRRHTSKTHTGLRHPAHNIQRRLGTHTLRVHGPRASPTLSVWPRVASQASTRRTRLQNLIQVHTHTHHPSPDHEA
jgi:hypothetical protein